MEKMLEFNMLMVTFISKFSTYAKNKYGSMGYGKKCSKILSNFLIWKYGYEVISYSKNKQFQIYVERHYSEIFVKSNCFHWHNAWFAILPSICD